MNVWPVGSFFIVAEFMSDVRNQGVIKTHEKEFKYTDVEISGRIIFLNINVITIF